MKILGWLMLALFAITVINYPNPFNPQGGESTTIEASSTSSAESTLYVYDMAARLILQRPFPLNVGTTNRTSWNGYNNNNELVGSGVYLYRLIDASSRTTLAKGKIWVINR